MASLPLLLPLALALQTNPAPLVGPVRFCGQATMIDLADGETIEPLQVVPAMPERYRWSGKFGSIDVVDSNKTAISRSGPQISSAAPRRVYRQRRGRGWIYTLWDRDHLMAELSGTVFGGGAADLALIDRVALREPDKSTGCQAGLASW